MITTATPDLTTLDGIQAAIDSSPFQRLLGLKAVALDIDEPSVEIALPCTPRVARNASGNQLHGGALTALMDVAGDYALGIRLGYLIPTINLHADFLRPANGSARAAARILRCGRTIGVADIKVFDDDGRLVAAGRGSYSTRRPERAP